MQATVMTYINQRLSAAIFDSDLIASRIFLGLAEALWAVSLWWPGESFARPAYGGMSVVMHENAWGLVFALSAVTQLGIVAMGHFAHTYARIFAGWNFVLWAFVCLSMLLAVYPPPAAISGELVLCLAAGWIFARPILLSHWYRKASCAND